MTDDSKDLERPDQITPIRAEDLARSLRAGWRALFKETPERDTVLILLAQSAYETGRWKFCHCWNLGNVKSTGHDGHDFTYFRCNEVIDGKVIWFNPPHPQTRFRAFSSLTEGAIDHLQFLRNGRYAKAVAYALAGDPSGFCTALKAANYFTADLPAYLNSVTSIFREYQRSSLLLHADEDDAEELHQAALAAFAKNFELYNPEMGAHGAPRDRPTNPDPVASPGDSEKNS